MGAGRAHAQIAAGVPAAGIGKQSIILLVNLLIKLLIIMIRCDSIWLAKMKERG